MEGFQRILYFDDYHAQESIEAKFDSLIRLKDTLTALKISKKYLQFPFTLQHLSHLISQEKNKLTLILTYR